MWGGVVGQGKEGRMQNVNLAINGWNLSMLDVISSPNPSYI